ncbi:MAG: LamG domain-containing protein [Thermoguttaceae bacterium]|nr:LamG domain-containing protein [Thermoguttaceae bacterium]MDW8077919.1 LamG domain-containing protein [Thermoguttaceae bacterium]
MVDGLSCASPAFFPWGKVRIHKIFTLVNLWLLVFSGVGAVGRSLPVLAEEEQPWERLYSGGEATGPQVIALWQFLPGREAEDNSGRGHHLVLRGKSRFVPEGKFGNCLESFSVDRQEDQPVGAMAKNSPELTPKGAFTLEMWICPKPEIDKVSQAFLLDKKYYHYKSPLPQANCDYGWYLRRQGQGRFRMVVGLGFGSDSAVWESAPFPLEPGRWYHLAFAYDGRGTGRFFVDGKLAGRMTEAGRGPIAPGPHPLVIGDRVGSIHVGFPGYIDQVRIVHGLASFIPRVAIELAPGSRRVWVRLEREATLKLVVANMGAEDFSDAKLQAEMPSGVFEQPLGALRSGESVRVDIPVDTRLRPGNYAIKVSFTAWRGNPAGKDAAQEFRLAQEIPLSIVPPPLPGRMPVILWGTGPVGQVRQLGFTHQIVHMVDYRRVWEAGAVTSPLLPASLESVRTELDEHLLHGLGAVASLSPGAWILQQEELRRRFERIDRKGKPYSTADICGLFPELEVFVYNVGASVGKAFGDRPAFQAVLVHTEVRDKTNLCFHDHDFAAYRNATGQEVPAEVVSKWGFRYTNLKDFPPDRVVADDHGLLVFYRWFWKEGDGWNRLHSALHRGLRACAPARVWTWFDPAVRAPSLWGSGGQVDVLSQWTYTYPDPIKIGQATDELFAMAGGSGQQVMKMTQIIWYRSQTAPVLPEDPHKRAEWENRVPDAQFITIAPDHLREAFWVKISRPIRGIMYHGWGSLVDAGPGAYRYTNPETKEVLAHLIREVVEPLGPTLLELIDPPADVALLESFTSQMLAGRGTYGWGQSWEADVHLVLQWARLQPKIVYEETLLRDGLDGYRVLVLPGCDVLPRSVVERISAFQKAGGIVIGDENLCPAIKPDYVIKTYKRAQRAQEDKAALQEAAEKLREFLAERYQWQVDSSEPDAIVRRRVAGQAEYVFVVNDRRTFGNYVGHHGRVMEKGLPLEATVRALTKGRAVYDLVAGQEVPAEQTEKGLAWRVKLGPGEGKLFMIAPQAIGQVRISAERTVPTGGAGADGGMEGQIKLNVVLCGRDGSRLAAVVPVRVDLVDPAGRPADISGYYAARDGKLELIYVLAPNDTPGMWRAVCRELASGKTGEVSIDLAR